MTWTFVGKHGSASAKQLAGGLWQVDFSGALDWYLAREQVWRDALSFVHEGVLPATAHTRMAARVLS